MRATLALLFALLIPTLAFAAGDKLPARRDSDEDECETRAVATGGKSQSVMVVVGYMDDGTPILERQQITLTGHRQAARQANNEVAPNDLDRLLASATSNNPSAQALQELMMVSINRGTPVDAGKIKNALATRKELHPFAAVLLTNMAYLADRMDLVSDYVWERVAKALDNSDADRFPDFALLYSKVASDLLIHSEIRDPASLEKVARELKSSGKYEDDIQVAFRAGLAYLLKGYRNETIEKRLTKNLDNPRLPADLRECARELLRSLQPLQLGYGGGDDDAGPRRIGGPARLQLAAPKLPEVEQPRFLALPPE
jgi:hypothetical protein